MKRVIRESYDGGSIEVEPYDRATRPYAHASADGRIVLAATERGVAVATLHLTRIEVLDAVMILLSAVEDLDHAQTAPEGAGAAAAGDGRGALPVGGRTEATGLSAPPGESGRPNINDDRPIATAAIRMRAELVNHALSHAQRFQQTHRRYVDVSGATIAECATNAEEHAATLDGVWHVVGMEDGHGPTLAERPLIIDVAAAEAVAAQVHGTELLVNGIPVPGSAVG